NAGILSREVSTVFTKLGVTDGGSNFDAGVEEKDIMFDGMRCRLKGLTRRTGFKPVISGKLKEFGPTVTGAQIGLLEPGSSEAVADGTGTKVITPKAAGALYAAGDYVTGLRWILERGSSGFAAVYFPIAKCTKYKVTSRDKDEALIDFEFEAIGDPAVDLGTA